MPVSMSQLLNISDITNAIDIINANKDKVIVKQQLNNQINILQSNTPCLIAIKEECQNKFIPHIRDYIRAQNKGIDVYNFNDLDLNNDDVGIVGSPTYVYKAFRPEINKNATEVKDDYSNFILDMVRKVK